MSYSGAAKAQEAREGLGTALEALQQDSDIPDDVLAVAQNIAKAVGALFEAERASSETDGKACVKNALGSLSQTLALLQDVTQHKGIEVATEVLAKAMSLLYPLTTVPSISPAAAAAAPAAQVPAAAPVPREAAPQPPQAAAPAAAPTSPLLATDSGAGAHGTPHRDRSQYRGDDGVELLRRLLGGGLRGRRLHVDLRDPQQGHLGHDARHAAGWLRVQVQWLRALRSRPFGLQLRGRARHGHPVREPGRRQSRPGASVHPQARTDLLRQSRP